MRRFQPTCPQCQGRNTKITTSRRETDLFQVLYCDCQNEECLTRFKVEACTTKVISSLANELNQKQDQLSFKLA